MFHNEEKRNNWYNNWNFTEAGPWDGNGLDSMWYNLNTTLIA